MQHFHAAQLAWYAAGIKTDGCRHIFDPPVLAKRIKVRSGLSRRHLAIVDEIGFLVFGGIDDCETAAPHPRSIRFDHVQHERGCNRCIKGIAAFFQHCQSGLGCQRMRRRHHAVLGDHVALFRRIIGTGCSRHHRQHQ